MKKIVLCGTLLIAQSLTAMEEHKDIVAQRDYEFEFNANKAIRNSDSRALVELLIKKSAYGHGNPPSYNYREKFIYDYKFNKILSENIPAYLVPRTKFKTIKWEEIESKNNQQINKLMNDTRSINLFLMLKGCTLTFLGFAFINNLNDESYSIKAAKLLAGGLCGLYGFKNLANGWFYHKHILNKIQEHEVIGILIQYQLTRIQKATSQSK